MRGVSGGDIPCQVVCGDKDGLINVRLRFPQGPTLHYEEHLGTLDRDLSDFTLVDDHFLVKVGDKQQFGRCHEHLTVP